MMGNRLFDATMITAITNACNTFFVDTIGLNGNDFRPLITNYLGLLLYTDEETIFPEDFNNAMIEYYLLTRMRLALPDITVYKENLFSPTISNDITISRSLSGETNSANEMQPVNASIDTIDSPTAKAKGISSATEDVTESRPNEIRDNLLMRKEFRNILDILRGIIMPIFKFYTRIY